MDEYYLTEKQRIQLEIEKEEIKKAKKEKWKKRKKVYIIVAVVILLLIAFYIYETEYNVTVHKPVIYLYPEETSEVTVSVDFAGDFTTTYPLYENGWRITANPDGTLYDAEGKAYNYLYWEGISDVTFDMSEGFCVKGSDSAEFLEEALDKLGLTRREANEFIVYWLPLMEQNQYNVISFQTVAYEESAVLEVNPKPDTVIRVFMTWYGSNKPVDIKEQKLSTPERSGFTVVEWGGSMVK